MRKGIKIIWKWSWLLTAPITLIFFYWLWNTFNNYVTFNVHYDPTPVNYSLLGSGNLTLNYIFRKNQLAIFDIFSGNDISYSKDLKNIHLFVSEADLKKLNSNLPHSGQEYVKGSMLFGNKLHKVKIRYRGDFAYHWAFPKKSLRVKTSKKNLYEGFHKFNLIAPKQLNNYLSYRFATLMGLISPHAEMVNLFVNGKNHGTYLFHEQLEELTLRLQKHMPGDIYSGDNIGKDRHYPLTSLFKAAGIWEKISVNNHYPPDSKKPLEKLIHLISESAKTDVSESINQLLDIEKWGRFSAMETLMQSRHYDNLHNWRLYYDPYRSKIEPVVWDPVGWFFTWVPLKENSLPLDFLSSDLHKVLFRNADFIRARHNAIVSFFDSGKDRFFIKEASQICDRMMQPIEFDTSPRFSPDQRKRQMALIKLRIDKVFKQIRDGYITGQGRVKYKQINDSSGFSLEVSGRKPVKNLLISYLHPLNGEISAKIIYWRNGKKIEQDISGALSISGRQLTVSVPLISQFIPVNDISLDIKPAYYELLLKGIRHDNPFIEMLVDWGDRTESATLVDQIQKVEFSNMYAIIHSQPVKQIKIWKDVVEVNHVKEIDGELAIQPGTTVRLGPGAGLIIRGRLTAKGTEEKPIRFISQGDNQEPWSTIALIGAESNDSYLSYCEFSGGSGLKGDLFEYTGMFSIHDVKGVKVNRCRFSDSKITDDMVHAVYSDIHFYNCLFERAHSDALDLDISKAEIVQCQFLNSGNDAIDMMMNQSVVMNTLLKGSGDKGISVGEESCLFAVNNQFIDNEIGVQSKDKSVASIFNSTFTENRLALDAYKKNWRYNSGGKIFLYKGKLSHNIKQITADKHSTIKVYDTSMDADVADNKNITIDPVLNETQGIKSNNSDLGFIKETKIDQNFEPFLNKIDHTRRGSTDLTIIK